MQNNSWVALTDHAVLISYIMLTIIKDNVACIQQGIELIQLLDVALYTEKTSSVKGGSIGAHMRHNIDHYHCLLEGMKTGEIDYDRRDRDAKIETDPTYACGLMSSIIEELELLDETALKKEVHVKMDSGSSEESSWSTSSVYRELQFLVSHSIHHYALMAMLCRLQGIEPDAEFGVAPSTLKFLNQQLQGV